MKITIPAISLKVARSVPCFLFSFLDIFVGKEHHECPHPAHLCQRQRIVNLLPIVNIQLTLPEFFLLKLLQTKFLKSCSSPAVKAHKFILVQLSLPLSLGLILISREVALCMNHVQNIGWTRIQRRQIYKTINIHIGF